MDAVGLHVVIASDQAGSSPSTRARKPTDCGPWVGLLREAMTHAPLSVGLAAKRNHKSILHVEVVFHGVSGEEP
jgi:hypothetical protein